MREMKRMREGGRGEGEREGEGREKDKNIWKEERWSWEGEIEGGK